jgi:hypothetical protein
MSSPAIQFKGSGFYITDYPKGDKGSAPKSDGGKADRDAKTDKPAASTESKTEKSTATESSTSPAPASTPSASPAPAPSPTSASSSKD